MSNHKLFCVMAETCAGKDTLVNRLCKDTGMKKIISYTTRHRRTNEGDTHIFVDDSVYEQMKSEDKIAAFTEINGNKYWSTTDQLYENDVYIIDAKKISMSALGKYFPNMPMLASIVKIAGIMDEDVFMREMKASFEHKFAKKPEMISGNMKALELAFKEVC